jgi:glycosyltransferase involved in cell wall biosynthesis
MYPRSDETPVTVSAVMPTWNSARHLGTAIDSILAQSFEDWELIIVDDGSTDDTSSVLARYRDPRIRVYSIGRNRGRARARNMAVQHARGKYIAICDSDDISVPERFSREVSFLDAHPDIDVVSSQLLLFRDDAPAQPHVRFPEVPADIHRRFDRGRMAIANGACMMRSTCFDRYGLYCPELTAVEDFELFLRMYRTSRFQTLAEPLVLYRHESRGVSFREWTQTSRYHRYALYRAYCAQQGSADGLSFDEFTNRLQVRIAVLTIDLLRFVHYKVAVYTRPRRILR